MTPGFQDLINSFAVSLLIERIERIELPSKDWKSLTLTIMLYPQNQNAIK